MLTVVCTPIGNLEDASPRVKTALETADLLAAEDTRRTRTLYAHFELPRPPKTVSYREENEKQMAEKLLGELQRGVHVVLCSDGGYPGISDPGFRLLKLASEAGIEIDVVPGPGAVPTALLLSGLSTSSYTFKGFGPRKSGQLKRFLELDAELPHTLVFFESPFRVGKLLTAALEVYGDRQAAVCREMTKKHQEVVRGYLSDLAAAYRDKKVKGEVTIVIAGNNEKFIRPATD